MASHDIDLSTFRIEQIARDLNTLVNDVGLANVLEVLAVVCHVKSRETRAGDLPSAKWSLAGRKIGAMAETATIKRTVSR